MLGLIDGMSLSFGVYGIYLDYWERERGGDVEYSIMRINWPCQILLHCSLLPHPSL
jgi:hypothetical protein